MNYIFDRIIIFLMSFFIMCQNIKTAVLPVYVLLALLMVALDCLYEDRRINIGICLIYVFAGALFPETLYMLPIIGYGAFLRKTVTSCMCIVCSMINVMTCMEPQSVMYIAVMLILAYMLSVKSQRVEELSNRVKQIRDDSIETNIRLSEKNRQLIEKQDQEVYVATLKERNRIAREIHDNVGHMLTRSILQMGALMTIHKEEPIHTELDMVKGNLDIAMNNIRESVHDLHDESIDLEEALKEIVNELSEEFSAKLTYDVNDSPPREYKYAIIGVTKEAASNVMKHSSNDCVSIMLREHPGMYQLIIHDYLSAGGKKRVGKQTVKQSNGGIGISNMEDRVTKFNGQVRISNDDGYKVFATFMK